MLEGQVNTHQAKPSPDRDWCGAEQHQHDETWTCQHDAGQHMAAAAIQPIESLRAVMDSVQPPQKRLHVAVSMHHIEAKVENAAR